LAAEDEVDMDFDQDAALPSAHASGSGTTGPGAPSVPVVPDDAGGPSRPIEMDEDEENAEEGSGIVPISRLARVSELLFATEVDVPALLAALGSLGSLAAATSGYLPGFEPVNIDKGGEGDCPVCLRSLADIYPKDKQPAQRHKKTRLFVNISVCAADKAIDEHYHRP
jgi:hypothetical protein